MRSRRVSSRPWALAGAAKPELVGPTMLARRALHSSSSLFSVAISSRVMCRSLSFFLDFFTCSAKHSALSVITRSSSWQTICWVSALFFCRSIWRRSRATSSWSCVMAAFLCCSCCLNSSSSPAARAALASALVLWVAAFLWSARCSQWKFSFSSWRHFSSSRNRPMVAASVWIATPSSCVGGASCRGAPAKGPGGGCEEIAGPAELAACLAHRFKALTSVSACKQRIRQLCNSSSFSSMARWSAAIGDAPP
mmetsp:Transcript_124739/g.312007  ORF Transcript_124739/g.312007 Transcript_124739/m.312007 type:complete len:252 (+) Transcript_124739:404-1159(+)